MTGFIVGVLAIAVALKSGGARDLLKEKGKSQKKINDAKDKAAEDLQTSFDENIKDFLDKDDQINDDLREKLSDLDDEKKKRVSELVSSGSPEQDVANALKEILK